jgi:uncharacterized repeat protein (TIGR01451 family)
VPAGDQASFSFAVRTLLPLSNGVRNSASPIITNTATIDDDIHAPFTRTAATTILVPDLSPSEKQVSSATASPGQVLTYTILVKNTGSGPATVNLTDPLPTQVVYVPGSAWAGSGGPAIYDESTNRLTWSGRVPVSGLATIRFAAQVTGRGSITNRVLLDDGAGSVIERQVTTEGETEYYKLYLPFLIEPTPNP